MTRKQGSTGTTPEARAKVATALQVHLYARHATAPYQVDLGCAECLALIAALQTTPHPTTADVADVDFC